MVSQTRPKKRTSPAEGRALVQAWRDSGLSMAEFAGRDRAAMQRVSYWSRRCDAEPSEGNTAFVMMRVGDGPLRERSSVGHFEVCIGEQLMVRVASDTHALVDVLRAAREVLS